MAGSEENDAMRPILYMLLFGRSWILGFPMSVKETLCLLRRKSEDGVTVKDHDLVKERNMTAGII